MGFGPLPAIALRLAMAVMGVVIAKRQQATKGQQGKDNKNDAAETWLQAFAQRCVVEDDMQHRGDDQNPAQPFVEGFDQPQVDLEKE